MQQLGRWQPRSSHRPLQLVPLLGSLPRGGLQQRRRRGRGGAAAAGQHGAAAPAGRALVDVAAAAHGVPGHDGRSMGRRRRECTARGGVSWGAATVMVGGPAGRQGGYSNPRSTAAAVQEPGRRAAGAEARGAGGGAVSPVCLHACMPQRHAAGAEACGARGGFWLPACLHACLPGRGSGWVGVGGAGGAARGAAGGGGTGGVTLTGDVCVTSLPIPASHTHAALLHRACWCLDRSPLELGPPAPGGRAGPSASAGLPLSAGNLSALQARLESPMVWCWRLKWPLFVGRALPACPVALGAARQRIPVALSAKTLHPSVGWLK